MLLQSQQQLHPGDSAPLFGLKDFRGRAFHLDDFPSATALLIIFMCDHCPYVKAKINTIVEIDRQYRDRGLQIIGINSNDPTDYPEDSIDGMKAFSQLHGITFPYLIDATQDVAKAYGAVCTPDPFLFDAKRRLVYHGRIDDALNPTAIATTRDMAEAIEAVLSGKPVTREFLPSQGCSIKWKA